LPGNLGSKVGKDQSTKTKAQGKLKLQTWNSEPGQKIWSFGFYDFLEL
jgi:hypothetical protein